MPLLLNWRVWIALVLSAALAYSHWTVYHYGRDKVQQAWDREHAQTALQSIVDTKQVLAYHDATTKRLQAAIANRDAAVRDLSARLRDLKPSDLLPDSPAADSSGDASRIAELYRTLGERSLALASDAETVRQSLIACREQYQTLVK